MIDEPHDVAVVCDPGMPTGLLMIPNPQHAENCRCEGSARADLRIVLGGEVDIAAMIRLSRALQEVVSRLSVMDPETGELVPMPV